MLTNQHESTLQQAKQHSEKILRAHTDQTAFLQLELQRSRVDFAEREAKCQERSEAVAENESRLESLRSEERALNFELDEAVRVREELDHTNASVLILTDRCEAWQRSLHELNELYQQSDT
jgi:hypothetical protein